MTHQGLSRSRRGLAAVELAICLPLLLILLLGVWEIGRLIQVKGIIHNAAREGARLAAQGLIINDTGAATEIHVSTGTPNVEATVLNYLREAGIDTTGVTVAFAYVNGDTTKTHPFEADKNQRYRITVTVPFDNVRWTLLSVANVQTMTSTVEWESLVDDPFTLDTNIPNW